MPLIPGSHDAREADAAWTGVLKEQSVTLDKRVNIAVTSGSPPGLIAASQEDPFQLAGNYALGWTYFCIILLVASMIIRIYYMWTDKIRRALYKEAMMSKVTNHVSPDSDYEMAQYTNKSLDQLFPRQTQAAATDHVIDRDSSLSNPIVNKVVAISRWVFYRPTMTWEYRLGRRKRIVAFPKASIIAIGTAAFTFTMIYTFLPQPYFYQSIAFGSPPLAIRAGMISVAMVPWIIALSMKASLVSLITGIGHERLGVLHRWGGYICLALAVIHVVPFYITPVWDAVAQQTFMRYFRGQFYIYGTGLAALVPLGFLCIHSLPIFRSLAYEMFVVFHIPAAVVFVGMLIWHCNNALNSWGFMWATVGIWAASLLYRLYYLNWSRWWRRSFLCGEEASIVLLPENAIKITVPTQLTWKPGQFVYLRVPGISFFENHPFTISSLCSEEFTSDYGDDYRDLTVVFRPFGGFTRKVAEAAERNGPDWTYRAFLDGPYGGMQRELASFDTVVLIAGGSGITAIVSQLLLLIKKMREGTSVTKQVHVLWALRRPETAEWFKEELKICRQNAPPDSVHCQFFITASKRQQNSTKVAPPDTRPAPPLTPSRLSPFLHDRVDAAFQGIATKRNSALVREQAEGDPEKEKELTRETEDDLTALPQAHIRPATKPMAPRKGAPMLTIDTKSASNPVNKVSKSASSVPSASSNSASTTRTPPPRYQHFATTPTFHPPPRVAQTNPRRIAPTMKVRMPSSEAAADFDFGFPSTPTALQKNLVRFAFMPGAGGSAPSGGRKGWHTEYGRPDLSYMLRQMEHGFGRRTAIFVCGPPSMRHDVRLVAARLQEKIFTRSNRDEIFLWGEEYAL